MHSSTSSFEDLFKSGRLDRVDRLSNAVVISADGREFRTHKYILSKGSHYFRAFFKGQFREEDLELDFDGETLESTLIYLYTDTVTFNKDNLISLAIAADYLLIDRLLEIVRNFALQNLSVDNCVQLLNAGCAVERLGIAERCYRWVQIYFGRIVNREDSGIEQLPLAVLKKLLLDDSLGVRDEKDAWTAIKKWLEHDVPDRLEHFPDLVSRLRLTPANKSLAGHIANDALLKEYRSLEAYFERTVNPEVWSVSGPQTVRCPRKVYVFLSNVAFADERDTSDVFVTYDERPDVWRPVAESGSSFDELIPVDGKVFMFDTFSMPSTNRIQALDLATSSWHPLGHPKVVRQDYHVARCQDRIYVLGGYSFMPDVWIPEVECYCVSSESWGEFAPLPPFQISGVGVIGAKMYVVGCSEVDGSIQMRAMVGDELTRAWKDLPEPAVPRRVATVIAYNKKLYVLGGRRPDDSCTTAAEVFDPESSTWSPFADLPLPYLQPKAIELYEKLVVYDDHIGNRYIPRYPPCIWREDSKSWALVSIDDPMNDIHNYHVCAIEDFPTVSQLVWRNRKSDKMWEPTPFRYLSRDEMKR